VIVKSAGGAATLIIVTSFTPSFDVLVSPPPETDAMFVIDAAAFAATFTVTVIAG
jgi:hypothetical protein